MYANRGRIVLVIMILMAMVVFVPRMFSLTRGASPPARKVARTVFSSRLSVDAVESKDGVQVEAFADIMSEYHNRNLVWWLRVNGVLADQELDDRQVYRLIVYRDQWFELKAPCKQVFPFRELLPLDPGDYVITVGLMEQKLDAESGAVLDELGPEVVTNSTDVGVPAR